MVHAAGAALAPMVVGSVALAEAATPPPDTETWLVTLAGAFAATFTVNVMGGELAPAANASPRLQPMAGETAQVQPLPCMETAESPTGKVSDTCTTGAAVVGAPPVLLAVMV